MRRPERRRAGPGHRGELGRTVASASTPARQSARSACSAGEWETPVGLRTNSIAVGTPAAARMPASWPAPVASTRRAAEQGGEPVARARRRTRSGRSTTPRRRCRRAPRRRRRPPRDRPRRVGRRAGVEPGRDERRHRVDAVRHDRTLPHVARASCRAAAPRAASTTRAKASIGSRRSTRRVVPAWLASPGRSSATGRAARSRCRPPRRGPADRAPGPARRAARRTCRPGAASPRRARGAAGSRPAWSAPRPYVTPSPSASPRPGRRQRPGEQARARAGDAEARALLVAEHGDPERTGRPEPARPQGVDRGEGATRRRAGRRTRRRRAPSRGGSRRRRPDRRESGSPHHAQRLPARSSTRSIPRAAASPANHSRRSASSRVQANRW